MASHIYHNLDYTIFVSFICITMLIAFVTGKRVKTLKDYALGGGGYGTTALVMTYLATDIGGGSVFCDAVSVFKQGIIVYLSITSLAIAFVVRAYFIAPHLMHFKGCLTMGEIFGQLYGKYAQMLVAVLNFWNSIFLAAIQFIFFGVISESLLGIPSIYGILVGNMLVTFYATFGGIKAVASTDIFQFVVLVVFIPSIAILLVNQIGGIEQLFTKLPPEKLTLLGHKRFHRYLTYFFIWLFQLGMIDPAIIQRMLMAKNKHVLKVQYLVISCFDPIFRFLVALIGLGGYLLYPTIEPIDVLPHIIQHLLPVGLKGLAIAGLFAVVMSSADSYVHTAGLTLVHDLIKPLYHQSAKRFNKLHWVRYTTLLAGLVSTAISIQGDDASNLGFKALELTGPMLIFPFMAGIFGLQSDPKIFFTTVICTAIAFMTSSALLPGEYNRLAILMGTGVNGMVFFGMHYAIHRKFKKKCRHVSACLQEYQIKDNQ